MTGSDFATTTASATAPGGSLFGTKSAAVSLWGHCTSPDSIILWQRQSLPFYLSISQAVSEASAVQADCAYSTVPGHTGELVYNLNVPDAIWGQNLYCIAEATRHQLNNRHNHLYRQQCLYLF